MSTWQIVFAVGGVLVIAVLAALGWFLREELGAVLKTFGGIGSRIGDAVRDISALFWLIWCYVYAMRWRVRFWFQSKVGRTTSGILFFGSFFIVLELVVGVLHALGKRNHADAGGPDDFLAQFSFVGQLLSWLELPWWVEPVLVVLAVFVLVHHYREWRLRE